MYYLQSRFSGPTDRLIVRYPALAKVAELAVVGLPVVGPGWRNVRIVKIVLMERFKWVARLLLRNQCNYCLPKL